MRISILGAQTTAGVYYPHDSGNKKDSDPEGFVKRLRANQEYIYRKFPLEAVRIWMDEPFYLLNQILMEKGKMQ